MAKQVLKALLLCAVVCLHSAGWAGVAASASEDPVLEVRTMAISSELRCLVCQNQTIADSHAELAIDLRNQVREMLVAGKSEQEITDYMTARYGDFVLYRPPFKAVTALLWIGPAVMVVIGLGVLFVVLRRRSRMDADQFEPEEPESTV
jgi:cytochrome c-type biogenesis protein CcmH